MSLQKLEPEPENDDDDDGGENDDDDVDDTTNVKVIRDKFIAAAPDQYSNTSMKSIITRLKFGDCNDGGDGDDDYRADTCESE